MKKKKRVQGNNHKKFSKKNLTNKGDSSKKEEIICYECKNLGHLRGECPKLLKKFKKEKPCKPKAMITTWSEDVVPLPLFLMPHPSDR